MAWGLSETARTSRSARGTGAAVRRQNAAVRGLQQCAPALLPPICWGWSTRNLRCSARRHRPPSSSTLGAGLHSAKLRAPAAPPTHPPTYWNSSFSQSSVAPCAMPWSSPASREGGGATELLSNWANLQGGAHALCRAACGGLRVQLEPLRRATAHWCIFSAHQQHRWPAIWPQGP